MPETTSIKFPIVSDQLNIPEVVLVQPFNWQAIIWFIIGWLFGIYAFLIVRFGDSGKADGSYLSIERFLPPWKPGDLPKAEERKAIGVLMVAMSVASLVSSAIFYCSVPTHLGGYRVIIPTPYAELAACFQLACWTVVLFLFTRNCLRTGKAYWRHHPVVHRTKDPSFFRHNIFLYSFGIVLFSFFILYGIFINFRALW